MTRTFEVGPDVAANVKALRAFLGSVERELSLSGLAKQINARHPHRRKLNSTTIARWEDGGVPDFESLRIMATLAGVTFELFTLGDPNAKPQVSVAQHLTETIPEVPATAKPVAKKKKVPTKRAIGTRGPKGK